MKRMACVGERMVELSERPDGTLMRGFGGDTLNTTLYLARLGVAVDYVTALGTDPFSDNVIQAWEAEGIGTERVLRVPNRLPSLYLIQTDIGGERRNNSRVCTNALEPRRISQTNSAARKLCGAQFLLDPLITSAYNAYCAVQQSCWLSLPKARTRRRKRAASSARRKIK